MKKLTALIASIVALSLGTFAIHGQSYSKKRTKNTPVSKTSKKATGSNYHRGRVYTYVSTRIVRKRHGTFKNKYLHKVFPNGREQIRLISSKKISKRHNGRTFYRTKTVYRGNKTFRVTYKITRYPNGRVVKKVVKRVRIRNW